MSNSNETDCKLIDDISFVLGSDTTMSKYEIIVAIGRLRSVAVDLGVARREIKRLRRRLMEYEAEEEADEDLNNNTTEEEEE